MDNDFLFYSMDFSLSRLFQHNPFTLCPAFGDNLKLRNVAVYLTTTWGLLQEGAISFGL